MCDICGKSFSKKRVDLKSDITLCGNTCRNQYLRENNPNPKKDKIEKNCEVCGTTIEVFPSKLKRQDNFLCSRECYKKHRSDTYSGNKIYNYQDLKTDCSYCGNAFKTIEYDLQANNHLFCTQDCYWLFRKENYKEVYYNHSLNDNRKETTPEKMVREFLSNNKINFEQEKPMFRKYYIDFYLPDYGVALEVYGDYWHANPEKYNQDNVNENQIRQIEYDKKRNLYIRDKGFEVKIIWESDIHKDLEYYMRDILSSIKLISKNP
ncbi:hypothetical protein [Microcystis phage MaeS]|nr:hypothetical protein [Microcystis phage MaeS]